MDICKNCEQELAGEFCAQCGQKADTRRIGWSWFGHEVMTSVFVVDRGLLFTIKELFSRPGTTIKAYLEGKRKQHFKPLAFVLVTAAVYSLLYRLMPLDLSGAAAGMAETMEGMNALMGQYYALIELALLPLFAMCTRLFLGKYGHNFVEHLVIQSFLSGQRIIINSVMVPLNSMGVNVAMTAGSILGVAYLTAYLIAIRQLYREEPVLKVLVRAVAAFCLFFFLLLVGAVLTGFLWKTYWR